MRIVAGSLKGQALVSPEGRDTRPTAARARESLFNLLMHGYHAGRLRDARVADLFAGTGALGLEALSRGAAHCVFVENDRPALAALRKNVQRLKVANCCDVLGCDAARLPRAAAPCDIVVLDPPYGRDLTGPALSSVLAQGWLAPDGLVAVQLHPKDGFEEPPGLRMVDDRKYGATRFVLLEADA